MNSNMSTTTSSRNLGLDVLRLAACLLVIFRHHPVFVANPIGHAIRTGGWMGVDLFFVLSGYLISSLLFKEHLAYGRINITRFLIRRAFKIYPAFWVLIAVTLLIDNVLLQSSPQTGRVYSELLFVQNYFPGLWSHTWSLAVEEHFYLGIALMFAVLIRRNGPDSFRILPHLFFIVAIVCLALRVATASMLVDYHWSRLVTPSHLRIDSLLFGVLLSYLKHYKSLDLWLSGIRPGLLFLGGAACLLPGFLFQMESLPVVTTFGLTLFYVGSGCLVLESTRIEASASLIFRALGRIGTTSYSIYLWHMPIAKWVMPLLHNTMSYSSPKLDYVLYVCLSITVGYCMARVIELPALKLREWMFPARSHRTRDV